MNKSETIGQLAKALSIVQGQLTPAKKDSANPFFKSKYADLNSVWDACRDLLAKNNLAVAQLTQKGENGVIVETVLMHESGEWLSGEMFLPLTKQDAQAVGSAISYGRRYALASLIGVVADDDDGNHASQKQTTQPVQRPLSLIERIRNAEKALVGLGKQVTPVNTKGLTDAELEQELKALNEQYKRAKANA